VYIVILSQYHV